MLNLYKRIFLVFFSLLLWGRVYAVSDSVRYQISFCPQYLVNNGLKIGFDLRISNKNWISVSPEFYHADDIFSSSVLGANSKLVDNYSFYSSSGLLSYSTDALKGFAVSIEDKIFLGESNQYTGTYLKFGFNYTWFNITYNDYAWQPYLKNGLSYYDLVYENGNIDINKYGFMLGFGIAKRLFKTLRADFVFGLGDTNAHISNNMDGTRNYTRTFFDYASDGVYPVITFQIGYPF